MTLAALVLAAGRGERLRPLTDHTPKPLLDVGGTTLLDAALARVAAVVSLTPRDVAVNAHWLADQIVAAVGDRAHVSVEEPDALGTAGAVGALHDWLAGRDVLIANGDAWFSGPVDVRRFVGEWDRTRPRLLVVADAERPDFEQRWRFAGLSLLPGAVAAALEPVPSGLYEVVWSRTPVELVPTDVEAIDCGTPEDLARARSLR
ncbi:MAG: N-acetyl-alpha-D-muramate 1-phosphate uridylyltransferase [Frankiaceae bacterium]|jgi:CTP:molybdopterin cytidylyltransferase MocA|nr:N-acetyl-alpha-D-muramate 1-phosphate uridylyltransferase [Frankiaceae bacterium]